MEACGAALKGQVEWSLEEVVRGEGEELERVEVVQPVLWAVMVSLAGMGRGEGLEVSGVVGHSQGEIAAACVAGALTLEEGARVVAVRSRALRALSGRGGMVSLGMGAVEAEELLSGRRGLERECEGSGVGGRRVEVDYASHSEQVGEVREEVMRELGEIRPGRVEVEMVSTVTGRRLEGGELDGEYWYRNLRERVRFEEATRELLRSGNRLLVEVSPHPVLTLSMEETVEREGVEAEVMGPLGRGEGGMERWLRAVAEVEVRGAGVDWGRVYGRFWEAVERGELEELSRELGEGGEALGALAPALVRWRGERRRESEVERWRYRAEWREVGAGGSGRLRGR